MTAPFPPPSVSLASRALALRQAARAGGTDAVLRGKNFGLLCEDQDGPEARLFRDAAAGLGAQVARIRPSVAGLLDDQDVASTAVWLGRLYDAIECQGLPGARVAKIRAAAGIPVFDGMGSEHGADEAVAALVNQNTDEALARLYVLQAGLIAIFR